MPAQLFPSDWLWLANLIFGTLLFKSIRRAPWRALLANGTMVNALVALTLGGWVMWKMSAGFKPGFNHHILGATLFLLMFGRHIALVMLSLILAVTWVRADLNFLSLGLNGLTMIVLPVLFSEWMLNKVQQNLAKNFFVYILLNGFLCSALAMMLAVTGATLVMLGLTAYTWPVIAHSYLIAAPIIVVTEAFLTGMLLTAFVLFQPQAVSSFRDEDYLVGK